jgi:hypothetical protein
MTHPTRWGGQGGDLHPTPAGVHPTEDQPEINHTGAEQSVYTFIDIECHPPGKDFSHGGVEISTLSTPSAIGHDIPADQMRPA